MKNILIHGLGQNSKDWDTIKNELETRGISPIVPDLFDLTKGRELDYPTVYQAFSELCESYKDKLNLCGLSLGGLLALNYAIQYPKKINSLVLIGKWCYTDGKFTYDNIDDLIAFCVEHMSNENWSAEQVRGYMADMLPKLNHWKTQEKIK